MKGTFLCEVVEHCLAESDQKKTPSVKIKVSLLENVGTKEYANGELYVDLWLTDSSFERTMKTLTETLGWDGSDLSDLNTSNCLAGKRAWAVVEEESFDGRDGTMKSANKIKWLNPVGGGRVIEKMDSEFAKSLSEKLKGKILSYRQNNPVAKAQPKDDLPF